VDFDDELTLAVMKLSREHGFARVGIAPAGPIASSAKLRDWLGSPHAAEMEYLRRHVEKRLCPSKLLPGSRCVICLAVSYATGRQDETATAAKEWSSRPRLGSLCEKHRKHGKFNTAEGDCATSTKKNSGESIATYARGRNYHKVLKARAHKLCDAIKLLAPGFQGRSFVDTAPLAERALAVAAGLGWIGQNGSLIVPGLGSYVVLAEIVCNLPLRPSQAQPGSCEDCNACVSACPTGAIVSPGIVDCRACLSYHTIENRGKIPEKLWPKLGSRVFGCDVCLSVCPHNRPSILGDSELQAPPGWAQPGLAEVLRWSHEDWDAATQGRATRRASYEMFLRNAVIAAGNSENAMLIEPLKTLQASKPSLTKEIAWALSQLTRQA